MRQEQQVQGQQAAGARQAEHPASGGSGVLEGDRGDAAAQPSGPRGDNPATAGSGESKVNSATPENAVGEINPGAPAETGTTTKLRP